MGIRKYFTGLALAGLVAGVIYMNKDPVQIIPVVTWPNDQQAISRTIYDPNDKDLTYVDEKPFGSVDYVIDWTSGERVKREPEPEDISKFSELEREVKERGLLPK